MSNAMGLRFGVVALGLAAFTACQFPSYDEETVVGVYGKASDVAALKSKREKEKDPDPKPLVVDKPIFPDKDKGKDWLPEPNPGKMKPIQADWPPQDPDADRPPHPRPDRPDVPEEDPYPSEPPYRSGDGHGPDESPSRSGEGTRPGNRTRPVQPSVPGLPGEDAMASVRGSVLGDACASLQQPARASSRRREEPMCIALKYVVYQDAQGNPIETDRDVIDNVREVNQLWRDCGIQFQVEQYLPIEPAAYRLRYRTAHYTELDEIRRRFMDNSTFLVVTTGTWNRAGSLGNSGANAWTNMPGEGLYGVVLEKPVGNYPYVLAHELGHYLSLEHASDSRDLMHPIVYRSSTGLSASQCQAARWAAGYFWKKMLR